MKIINLFAALIIVFVSFLSSCSIEKRHYMSGYNIEWKTWKHNTVQANSMPKSVNNTEAKPNENNQTVNGNDENLTASSDSVLSFIPLKKSFEDKVTSPIQFVNKHLADECDLMVLANGDELKVKVMKIGPDEIFYKKCENLTGPDYFIKKSDVFMIKYPNGTKDVFSQTNTNSKEKTTSNIASESQVVEGLGVTGFIASILGLLVAGIPLGLLAFIFGFISIGKISNNPRKFWGGGFAIVSIILGMIDIVGAIVAIQNTKK
ncbi:MAG: DUF4190 domain-containing protein [Bacteroidota bacterium]